AVGAFNAAGIGAVLGGNSVATGAANGGDGGAASLESSPTAVSGDSGLSRSQASATNTGATGDATSRAVADPQAISGNSGATGATGPATSDIAASNGGILGTTVAVGGDAVTGDSGDSGATGAAAADAFAVSFANSGALAISTSLSGNTGGASNFLGAAALGGFGGNGGVAVPIAGDGGLAVGVGVAA